jgi:hypothetical protein
MSWKGMASDRKEWLRPDPRQVARFRGRTKGGREKRAVGFFLHRPLQLLSFPKYPHLALSSSPHMFALAILPAFALA